MNSTFNVRDARIKGVKIITPFYIEDERGYFLKNFEKDVFHLFGLKSDIFEDFESFSKKNVIRGLHFQLTNPQIKIVRVIKGAIRDVVLDLRKDSKTFGEWEMFSLTEENREILYIPAGFAHGFCVQSDCAVLSYKCIGKYNEGTDSGIFWNDSKLGINWNIENPIISERDKQLQSFDDFIENFKCLEIEK